MLVRFFVVASAIALCSVRRIALIDDGVAQAVLGFLGQRKLEEFFGLSFAI
jgi:hypothetical protein